MLLFQSLKVTEYYELIDDKDMQTNESYHRMIIACINCGALFSMKACGNRSLFPWFGYHPTDGNCQVMTDAFNSANRNRVNKCNCDDKYMQRLRTKAELDKIISQTADIY
jgi:hypothetical protein